MILVTYSYDDGDCGSYGSYAGYGFSTIYYYTRDNVDSDMMVSILCLNVFLDRMPKIIQQTQADNQFNQIHFKTYVVLTN